MKKIIALLLCAVMILSVSACAKKPTDEIPPADTDNGSVTLNPNSDHSLVALESENYKVTNGMLSYIYLSGFYSVYASYSSYFDGMGFDSAKALKEQQYTEDMTWHDYFLEMTLGDTRRFLQFAEAARAEGMTSEDLKERVEKQIQSTITDGGVTLEEYITKMFGDTLSEEDLRAALELQLYAYDYYDLLQKRIGDGITTEDYETYYNENSKQFSKVDYISYTITASTANTEDAEAAYADAKKSAEELVSKAESEGVEGFKSWVTDYMTKQNDISTAPMSADALKTQIEKTLAGTTDASYSEGNELAEWAFEDGRAVGDCKLVDNGAGSYTVNIITAIPHRANEGTKDVRHILLKPESYDSKEAAKTKAEELLDEWKKGEATVESFDAIAEEYNDDGSSLYENVTEGEMVDTFNDWLFDPARIEGETGIVETNYGYHIMYFVGDGLPVWQKEIKSTLISARLSDVVTEYETTYGEAITESEDNISKLPDTIPQSAFESSNSNTNVYE